MIFESGLMHPLAIAPVQINTLFPIIEPTLIMEFIPV